MPIALKLNPPPPIPHVFDPIIKSAAANVLDRESPSDIIGHHRWCGTEADRHAGAKFCAERLGYRAEEDRLVLTNSTQSSLSMLIPGIVGAGEVLAVEELTYPPMKVFAARCGVRLVPVALDADGIDPDAFRQVCAKLQPKALYALSTLQNPTTITMPLRRRREIVDVARKFGVAIIEDDIYSLIPKRAPPPLSALAPDISWYLLGLAKSVAPGMKVAYVVSPSKETAAKLFWPGVRATYWMTSPLSAALATELIEAALITKILNAVRHETLERLVLVHNYLADVDHRVGEGGLHVWIPTPKGVTSLRLATELEEKGVLVSASHGFVVGEREPPSAIRIGIGNPPTGDTLSVALEVLADVYSRLVRGGQ